jgi:hypothetical protein
MPDTVPTSASSELVEAREVPLVKLAVGTGCAAGGVPLAVAQAQGGEEVFMLVSGQHGNCVKIEP